MAGKHEIFLDSDEDDVPLASRIKLNRQEIVSIDDDGSNDSIPASQVTVIHISPTKSAPECVVIPSESPDNSRPSPPPFSPDPFYHQSPDPFYEQMSPLHSPQNCLPENSPPAASAPCESRVSPPPKPPSPEPEASQSCSQSSLLSSQSSQVGRAPLPAISMRDCSAVVPQTLFDSKFCTREELRKAFSEFDVRFTEIISSDFPNTITWLRQGTDGTSGENVSTAEDQVLVILKMEQVVTMVDQFLRKSFNGFRASELVSLEATDSEADLEEATGGRVDFIDLTKNISRVYPQSSMILMLTGMPAYFRRLKNKEQQKFRDAIRGTQARKRKSIGLPVIKEKDLIDACVDLDMKSSSLMPAGSHLRIIHADKADEIATLIASFAKSVAEAPHKRKRKEERNMAWYAENDSKFAVDIKEIPQDVIRLWKKQLEQFPKVSRDVAEAIAKVYPNPLSLINAYTLASRDSGPSLLENIRVGKGSRKVGHEISRKMCTFFTSTKADEFL